MTSRSRGVCSRAVLQPRSLFPNIIIWFILVKYFSQPFLVVSCEAPSTQKLTPLNNLSIIFPETFCCVAEDGAGVEKAREVERWKVFDAKTLWSKFCQFFFFSISEGLTRWWDPDMIRKQENFWKTDRRVLGKVFETEVHLINKFNQVSWSYLVTSTLSFN